MFTGISGYQDISGYLRISLVQDFMASSPPNNRALWEERITTQNWTPVSSVWGVRFICVIAGFWENSRNPMKAALLCFKTMPSTTWTPLTKHTSFFLCERNFKFFIFILFERERDLPLDGWFPKYHNSQGWFRMKHLSPDSIWASCVSGRNHKYWNHHLSPVENALAGAWSSNWAPWYGMQCPRWQLNCCAKCQPLDMIS